MTHAQHAGGANGGHPGRSAPGEHQGHNMYRRFAVMIAISFVAMYVLMYAMVNAFGNVYNSLNQAYMAGLMAASMVIIELAVMWGMYKNRKLNFALMIGGAAALLLCWMGIRRQVAIGDAQFLRSMIPHHAGAILMCQQAPIGDPRIVALCNRPNGIIESQQAEITQMKEMLRDAK